MKKIILPGSSFLFLTVILFFSNCFFANGDTIPRIHQVTLREAHIGNLEIDTRLLDSYGRLPENIRRFYLDVRAVFESNENADFTHPKILGAAQKHNILLMGGPMLGDIRNNRVVLWMRPATAAAWCQLAANVPLYAGWDDHDYLNNDLSGIP